MCTILIRRRIHSVSSNNAMKATRRDIICVIEFMELESVGVVVGVGSICINVGIGADQAPGKMWLA